MTIINDLEGLGDLITKIIVPFSRAKAREQIRFSEEGFRELMNMFDRSNENFMLIINAFATNNLVAAERVRNSERTFEVLIRRLRTAHMRRVFQHKVQSIETSTLHMDLLQCFKRINLHSIEIAKTMCSDMLKPGSSVNDDQEKGASADADADIAAEKPCVEENVPGKPEDQNS
jgi:phosphate:Na+ symporter